MRFAIPQRVAHPAVVVIWQTLNRRPELTLKGVARRSGLDVRTIRGWAHGVSPRLADIEAVLNAINLRLTVESMLTVNTNAVS
jgi:DNA-binding phage protein